jgi:uncharacterized protein (TIGR02466 family)
MINYYFPTAVFSELNEQLAEDMLPVAKKYLNDNKFANNKFNYRNTFSNSWELAKQPDIKPYKDYITSKSKSFMNELGYDLNPIELDSMVFVSEMFKGNHHGEHTHPDSIISGLLYLQVPENSAPLIILDPRPHRNFISLPKSKNSSYTAGKHLIMPRKGLFLCWESWLPHVVPETGNVDEGRITMVFNLGRKQ